MAVQEQERARIEQELRRKAEEILEEMDVDRARLLAAEAGVIINAEPVVAARGVVVRAGRLYQYAYAWIRLYLPFYIVEVRKYIDGDVTVNIEPAVNVDNSCNCGGV